MATRIQSSWKLKLGLVALFVGIAWWGHAARDTRRLQVTRVRRGDLAQVLREEARTRFRLTYSVSAPFSGRLLRHELEEGARVLSGQVLAQFQVDLPRAALATAEAELEASRRELALVRDLALEEAGRKLAEAERAVHEAAGPGFSHELERIQAQRDLAEAEWRRIQELARRGAATPSQTERGLSERDHLRAAWNLARNQQAVHGARDALQEANLERAAASIQDQELRAWSLEARIAGLEAALVPLRDDLGRVEVRSPCDGVLLAVHRRSEGKLAAGTPLFEIGVPESLEVEVDLLSEDAGALRPGGLFAAFGRALGGREIPLELREISPRAFTKRSSLGVEEQRVHAWFTFRGPTPDLGHGYRLHLRAATAVARESLMVPRRAMVRHGRSWRVYRLVEGRARGVEVTPGPGDESWVSLAEGLEEGQEVLLDVPEELREGDPVSPRPAQDLAPPAPLPGGSPSPSPPPGS